MLNVLKNSILIVLFALVSSSGIPAQGQNLTLEEAHVAHEFYRNETCEAATIPLLLFFHESYELSLGYSHLVPDSKSHLVPSFLQRNGKNNTVATHAKRNLYFHPYSTLGKTKYYVFALREIIFSRQSNKLQGGPIPLQIAVTNLQLATLFPVTELVT